MYLYDLMTPLCSHRFHFLAISVLLRSILIWASSTSVWGFNPHLTLIISISANLSSVITKFADFPRISFFFYLIMGKMKFPLENNIFVRLQVNQ